MSTAETRTRRTPGLVPVSETLRTAEQRPPERPAVPAPVPPARAPWAFWRLLASELGLTFRRPRNLVMLAVLASVPILLGVTLRLVSAGDEDGMGGIIAAAA